MKLHESFDVQVSILPTLSACRSLTRAHILEARRIGSFILPNGVLATAMPRGTPTRLMKRSCAVPSRTACHVRCVFCVCVWFGRYRNFNR